MELPDEEKRYVTFLAEMGVEMRRRPKAIYIVDIHQYRCKVPFADIREDEIVFAGFDPHKGGYFISNERWADQVIGDEIFLEHFEMDEPYFHPDMAKCSPRVLRKITKEWDSRKYYK